jgi:hypothetical protein
MSSADRYVVEDAVPHTLVSLGVVTGRPYCAKRALDGSLQTLVHRLHDRTRSMKRSLVTARGQKSVRIKFSGSEVPDLLDVLTRMHSGNVVIAGPARFQKDQVLPKIGSFEDGVNGGEPVLGVGMPHGRLVSQEDFIVDEPDSFHERIIPSPLAHCRRTGNKPDQYRKA